MKTGSENNESNVIQVIWTKLQKISVWFDLRRYDVFNIPTYVGSDIPTMNLK